MPLKNGVALELRSGGIEVRQLRCGAGHQGCELYYVVSTVGGEVSNIVAGDGMADLACVCLNLERIGLNRHALSYSPNLEWASTRTVSFTFSEISFRSYVLKPDASTWTRLFPIGSSGAV